MELRKEGVGVVVATTENDKTENDKKLKEAILDERKKELKKIPKRRVRITPAVEEVRPVRITPAVDNSLPLVTLEEAELEDAKMDYRRIGGKSKDVLNSPDPAVVRAAIVTRSKALANQARIVGLDIASQK